MKNWEFACHEVGRAINTYTCWLELFYGFRALSSPYSILLNFHKSWAHAGLHLSVIPPPQAVFHFQHPRIVGVEVFHLIFTKGIFHLISRTVQHGVLLLPSKALSSLLDILSHLLQWHYCHDKNILQWADPSSLSARLPLVDTSQLY